LKGGGSDWPAGPKSLRDAAFGVDAGILDEHIQVVDQDLRSDRDGKHALAAYLQLPEIKTLYYRTASFLGDTHTDDDGDAKLALVDLPSGSSGVETLYLDNISGVSDSFLVALSNAPLKLQTLSIRLNDDGTGIECLNTFFRALQEAQADHLERFMFYSTAGLAGDRFESYLPEDMDYFWNLTIWYHTSKDLYLSKHPLISMENSQTGRR
jgi:hypothetical protein